MKKPPKVRNVVVTIDGYWESFGSASRSKADTVTKIVSRDKIGETIQDYVNGRLPWGPMSIKVVKESLD